MTVIVVDNASADGTPQMVAAEFPQVRLEANPTNRGFTGGNNDGLAAARKALDPGDPDSFALLLNPDTVVTPGALEALLSRLPACTLVRGIPVTSSRCIRATIWC